MNGGITDHSTGRGSGDGFGPAADWGRAYARVTAVRRRRFVEFDFQIGDSDLSVEMVLPYEAFLAFCEEHAVSLLPPAHDAAPALAALGAGTDLTAQKGDR